MGDVFRLFTGWYIIDSRMSLHIGMLPGKQKTVLYAMDENDNTTTLAVFSSDKCVAKARKLLNELGEGTNVKPI